MIHTDPTHYYNFRDFLIAELESRKNSNQRYSIRRFSMALKLNDSSLSQILRGRRKATEAIIRKVGLQLGINVEEIEKFVSNELGFEIEKFEVSKNEILKKNSNIDLDVLMVMIDQVPCDEDLSLICKKLAVSKQQLHKMIELLIAGKLLEIKEGVYKCAVRYVTTIIKSDACTIEESNYQKNLLQKSIRSIEGVDVSCRNHTSTVFKFNNQEISKAIELIRRFRRNFSQNLAIKKPTGLEEHEDVYALQVSFFPATNVQRGTV